MSQESATHSHPPIHLDYSLTGVNATLAVEKGLAEAEWYQCPVPRTELRKLLERRNGPAIRDTLIWFGLILTFGFATFLLWGTMWAIFPYLCYAVLYASTSDSRWHESSHGTAFKSDWMNNTLYEIASFMVMRESVVWRWSHTRHHSDTIIVGRDPEIVVPRPPDVWGLVRGLFVLGVYPKFFRHVLMHASGKMDADEKTYIPESEFPKVYRRARIYLLIYTVVISLAIFYGSILPLMYIGLANLFGSWLMSIYGLTQHAGLAENVLDHRLNCRTVNMNFINRYLYWNMNYHTEHHMFPLVPYHALPKLHALVKDDCPQPYSSILNAWQEIIPALLRQVEDPAWHVKRKLPEAKERQPESIAENEAMPDNEGWLEVCAAADLASSDVLRFDHGTKTFALIRDDKGVLYATDGICTHGNTHLADGLVIAGTIECPKHNGRFNLADGSPARAPICRGLATYPLEERAGRLWLNVFKAGGCGVRQTKELRFRVISNQNVATFIKELIIEPLDAVTFTPGDYLQFEIPHYDEIRFRDFDISEPYASVWRSQHVFDLVATNPQGTRRNNYSIASNQQTEKYLRFNIRIATPPPGQDCPPGLGSAYMFSLKAGDEISAIGPFGDFHIKPTKMEMVYIGGGAGMAPLRSHLSHLFESEGTARRVSFWYGARSRQEIFYQEYFEKLAEEHHNFTFHPALSSPLPEDHWDGSTGFIHEVVLAEYLATHERLSTVEFYLCGPPMMITACIKMLHACGVPDAHISFDEF